MRFTFRILRNADSGAGGGSPAPAPSATPAASGSTSGGGAAPSGDGGGSPAGGDAPAPAGGSSAPSGGGQDNSGKIVLPNRFDPSWETEFAKLSPEDQSAFFQNDPRFVEKGQEGDPPADPNNPNPPELPTSEITADDPITPEIMDSLPPNVKDLVDQALEMEERIAPYQQFLTPEFQDDLRVIMEDPRVMSIVSDMKSGADSADSWFEKSVDMDSIVKGLEDKFKINTMDFALDPEGSMTIFKNSLKEVAQLVANNVMIHGEIKAREAKEMARRDGVKNSVYFDLAQSVEALKSKEPIDSDKHPIHGFRNEIEESLANGEISWKYFEKNGKALFAAYAAKNGMIQSPQKQMANLRDRIIKKVADAATQAAVSSTTMRPGSQVPAANVRHGIDSAKYLSSSEAERSLHINRAIQLKASGDDSMLRDLQALETLGRWPG